MKKYLYRGETLIVDGEQLYAGVMPAGDQEAAPGNVTGGGKLAELPPGARVISKDELIKKAKGKKERLDKGGGNECANCHQRKAWVRIGGICKACRDAKGIEDPDAIDDEAAVQGK